MSAKVPASIWTTLVPKGRGSSSIETSWPTTDRLGFQEAVKVTTRRTLELLTSVMSR
ncbi:MAG: hypothetical protein U1F52_18470 [Burkholderiales bacterium]